MNVVVDDRLVQLGLAIIGVVSFVILLGSRFVLSRRYRQRDMGRVLLIDSLLVVSGLELVADALTAYAPAGLWYLAAQAVAFACRGALVAGAIALVATIGWRIET